MRRPENGDTEIKLIFRRNASYAFLPCVIGFAHVRSFVRHEISPSNISKIVWRRITQFFVDIHADIVYNLTGFDVITHFRLETIVKQEAHHQVGLGKTRAA